MDRIKDIIKELENTDLAIKGDIILMAEETECLTEKMLCEYIWQQGSWCINRYINKLPTVDKIFEENIKDFSPSGITLYRGLTLTVPKDKFVSVEELTNQVFNVIRNQSDKYISCTDDLQVAYMFSSISDSYMRADDYNVDNNKELKSYGVVLEIKVDKAIQVNERDMDEREFIIRKDDIINARLFRMYEVMYLASSLKEINNWELSYK